MIQDLSPNQMDLIDLLLPEDEIEMQYKNRKGTYSSLAVASAGQKTTAILTFILSFGNTPLILDQPEDDLDNRLVYDLIVDRIRAIKDKRQIIIVTHNANIPVNGDAEYVISLASESRNLRIQAEGSIRDMMIEVLKSKLHCVQVTEANLNYIGSITIDEDLMDAANLIAGEKVQVVNNNNGERFDTYIIRGERGSGCICLNGAAARKVQVGDTVIIISYALMDFEEAKTFRPTIVFPENNRVVRK